jgi:RsiW-degrading membrane proteinase PrsW (M82 family)
MGVIVCILLGFIPMFLFAGFIYFLDRYEKEPILLLGVAFFWGAIVASGAAFLINTVFGVGIYLITGSEGAMDLTTGSIIAPLVEESLKGFAVLLIFLIFRNEFDSVLDGIIYAAVTALGFAATENAYYIYAYGFAENGWIGIIVLTFIRVILVGWQHPFYTSFIGIGLATARLTRNGLVKFGAPVLGWVVAVITHSAHNTIASLFGSSALIFGTLLDWLGWLIMLGFIVFTIYRERKMISTFLRDEVSLGTLTAHQYQVSYSAWSRMKASFSALTSGRYRATNRFYQICANLAHKKHQLSRLGNESGNTAIILKLREELYKLSPSV